METKLVFELLLLSVLNDFRLEIILEIWDLIKLCSLMIIQWWQRDSKWLLHMEDNEQRKLEEKCIISHQADKARNKTHKEKTM